MMHAPRSRQGNGGAGGTRRIAFGRARLAALLAAWAILGAGGAYAITTRAAPLRRTPPSPPSRTPPAVAEAGAAAADTVAPAGVLRVCADPNNLPFSDREGRGFENRIAELIARDLHERVRYTWWAQRRGFVRNTLEAKRCDVIIGIDAGDEQVLTSPPYYWSTYVFVSRRERDLRVSSFDDPRLRRMRVGIHVIGDDYNALPPGVALARRGIVNNVRGYSIYGNYAEPSPPSKLIDAVARGDVDVAVAWGPLAGYYARRTRVPLRVSPVATRDAIPGIPFTYGIAIGVRRRDTTRLARLEDVLRRRRGDVRAILESYGVPLLAGRGPSRVAGRGRSVEGT